MWLCMSINIYWKACVCMHVGASVMVYKPVQVWLCPSIDYKPHRDRNHVSLLYPHLLRKGLAHGRNRINICSRMNESTKSLWELKLLREDLTTTGRDHEQPRLWLGPGKRGDAAPWGSGVGMLVIFSCCDLSCRKIWALGSVLCSER